MREGGISTARREQNRWNIHGSDMRSCVVQPELHARLKVRRTHCNRAWRSVVIAEGKRGCAIRNEERCKTQPSSFVQFVSRISKTVLSTFVELESRNK